MKHWIKSFCSFAFVVLLVSCHSKTEQLSMLIGHEDHYLQTGSCDFFRGRWVHDDSYPSYNSTSCPFIMKEFDCQKNGRPDTDYLKYRWKTRRCKLPRFNGLDFLRRFKGKRILFVGESLSLNQWKSLTCMLHVSVPQTNYTLERKGALSTFTLQEYRISVVLSRNGFLVDLVKEKMGAVLKLDSINNGNAWRGYDMLIFNTWHWWLHTGRKQPWDYIQQGDRIHKDMDRLVAFKEGLTTWSKWVDSNVDPKITKVFFQGISPTHFVGKDWNSSKSTTCHEETKPLRSSTYPKGSPPAVAVVKSVLKKISTHVTLLDVTTLSQLRKDGHPSIYGFGGKRGNDCSHWCLPGVPDTWNQLLYATLITP
ncbi:protein trichome birefringence-like 41 isoform X4 [Juglans regia]|uniref:Protein trichome birefringence-like 41 isoform X4 n=1 Tax=Juglans regia TaxID=51240 RepID=A0A6P9EPU1_JUGRE|nr:protein trichome birefringence-like 41 isoform X4 [Juglans regia]